MIETFLYLLLLGLSHVADVAEALLALCLALLGTQNVFLLALSTDWLTAADILGFQPIQPLLL